MITIKTFDELTTKELYEIFRARADVFVAEEKILYPDADGLDYDAVHIFSLNDEGRVSAYLRMFPKRGENGVQQIGRFLTTDRGIGLGRELMEAACKYAREALHAKELYLESQMHAVGFYEKCGFKTTSEPFIEAGIDHVKMRLGLPLLPHQPCCRALTGKD